jgi:hypothetical protein
MQGYLDSILVLLLQSPPFISKTTNLNLKDVNLALLALAYPHVKTKCFSHVKPDKQ